MLQLSRKLVGLVLTVAWCATATWCQTASLTGLVTERGSVPPRPINGADIIISEKARGTSGPDGKYLIDNLNKGAKLSVIYKKQGYGPKSETVMLTDVQTTHNVGLFKNTIDINYWSGRSRTVRDIAQVQGTDPQTQSKIYSIEWDEIEASRLSPEAKASAARQFSAVMPSTILPPKSLRAYSKVDTQLFGQTEENFQLAINGRANISVDTTAIPGEVAGDIAAKQIDQYEKDSKKSVVPKFFKDFSHIYGMDAGTKLKGQVAIDRQVRLVTVPNRGGADPFGSLHPFLPISTRTSLGVGNTLIFAYAEKTRRAECPGPPFQPSLADTSQSLVFSGLISLLAQTISVVAARQSAAVRSQITAA